MIAVNNQGPGAYPFFYAGGNTLAIASGSYSGGNATLNFTDEVGEVVRMAAFSGDTSTIPAVIPLPAGNYEVVIPSGVSGGFSLTLNPIP